MFFFIFFKVLKFIHLQLKEPATISLITFRFINLGTFYWEHTIFKFDQFVFKVVQISSFIFRTLKNYRIRFKNLFENLNLPSKMD